MTGDRDLVELEAREQFEDMMRDDDVPESEWDSLFEGFWEQYWDDYRWEMRGHL